MTETKLGARLSAAAAFARKGLRFADIGTDHAYLPVFLVSSGISPGGVASDVNSGPVAAAKKDIAAAGLGDKIDVRLGDGLHGTEDAEARDIYVLGMGGELIVRILSECAYIRDPDIRLILQPMTHHFDVRHWLLENGFDITDETLVREDGRIYQIIVASFDGVSRSWSRVREIIGKYTDKDRALFSEYAARLAEVYRVQARGLESAGKNASEPKALAEELEKLSADAAAHKKQAYT